MHIFIDESGLFSVTTNKPAWSSVGAVAIPDASLDSVRESLQRLKTAHGLEINAEFKRDRPDCASKPYQEFLRSLDTAGCTFHAVSTLTSSSSLEPKKLEGHKSATAAAIRKYASLEPDANPHAETIIAIIESLSHQEYNQCMMQAHMMCDMLPKIISHYAGSLPEEIGIFKWTIDRKNIVENKYEHCFKEVYVGLIMARSIRQSSSILGDRDYSAFKSAFSPDTNKVKLINQEIKNFGVNRTHLVDTLLPVSFDKLLEKDFDLEDSKSSIGLQVADLLTSSLNRCLKRNYTDNEKMAAALGKLMINAPRHEDQSLMVFGYDRTRPIANAPAKLIKIMDASSKKLYSEKFRENFSKNFRII